MGDRLQRRESSIDNRVRFAAGKLCAVDMFGQAEPAEICSLDEQQAWYAAWVGCGT